MTQSSNQYNTTVAAIKVKGEQARTFLQGQLTCDVKNVTGTHSVRGALCNTKGRILTLVNVVLYQDVLYLQLIKSQIAATIKSLSKAAMLSRVILTETTLKTPIDFATWHDAQLQDGHVLIYPETRGLYLPHQLELDKKGYISFDKGCYKGQEIIARMHYLGKIKTEFKLFHAETDAPLTPGQMLYDEKQTAVAELVDISEKYTIGIITKTPCPEVLMTDSQEVIQLTPLQSG